MHDDFDLSKKGSKMEAQKFELHMNKRNFFGKISVFTYFQVLLFCEII